MIDPTARIFTRLTMNARSFLLLLFAATSLLFGGCNMTKDKAIAESAVAQFHQQLDKGEFKEIYAAANADFKGATTEKDFLAILEAVHRKLGAVQQANEGGWSVNSYNLKTNVVLNYNTKFAGGAATESFTFRVENGQATLVGYNINSPTLILK